MAKTTTEDACGAAIGGCGMLLIMLAMFCILSYHSINYMIANGVHWPVFWLIYFTNRFHRGAASEIADAEEAKENPLGSVGKMLLYIVIHLLMTATVYWLLMLSLPTLGSYLAQVEAADHA